ncbi:MAG TPA: carboxypeptidase regulatory-like domain-containing protein [Thermoanaerobaculia bacterium]
MTGFRRFSIVVVLLLVAVSAMAQGTTGQLTGTVKNDGAVLPGVTVTATSPNLQGARVAITDVNGNYTMGALPPGEYTLRFEMEGLSAQTATARVGPGQTARADANLTVSALSEAITVTAVTSAVVESQQVQTSISAQLADQLPTTRTLLATANLAPGVSANGPGGNTVISGSYSYDNLWLVNGVAVNENLRGQPHNLFIEDAVQETTVMSGGGISAEFGRFTGGVVSAITKSGGNEFTGSLRDTVNNDSWTSKSEDVYLSNGSTGSAADPLDKVNSVYEGTLGGYILRDRLWFFGAGRDAKTSQNRSFARSSQPYSSTNESFRYEGKITGQLLKNHTLIGSYMDASIKATNNCQFGGFCLDETGLDPVIENPNSFWTAQYNGIITSNFLIEGNYANKKFGFEGFGGDTTDRILGTPIRDYNADSGEGGGFNAPQFNGTEPETRNSEQFSLKGTYYLGTRSLGSHSIVAGVDRWNEGRRLNNNQSASDFLVYLNGVAPTRDASGRVTSVTIREGDGIGYWPVLQSSLGSDSNTNSLFINDKWDFNDHLSFNLGARYDALDSVDSAGNKVADDSVISPRLGVTYDLQGNGRFRFNGSYSRYVARLADSIAGGSSIAGTPALYYYNYAGPDITGTSHQVLTQLFAWFDGLGGFEGIQDPDILTFIRVPGASQRLADGRIKSPVVDEFSFGFGTQIGTRGFARIDYMDRDWTNFYTVKQDRETGRVVVNQATGQQADLQIVSNSDLYERKYQAIMMQGSYRVGQRLNVGGNYTLSKLRGNVEGETAGSGPVSDTAFTYPEYQGYAQRAPVGYLLADQRHKARGWVSYDLPTPFGNFNFSLLERFDSGTPFSAIGTINTNTYTAHTNGLLNGYSYAVPQTTATYYFGERGAYRWDDVLATDFALNYDVPVGPVRLFAQAEVVNVLNSQSVIGGDASVLTARNANCLQSVGANAGQRCASFNPFTETPVEGIHWQKGSIFGKPTTLGTPANAAAGTSSFNLPRTYRFSFGVRF